MFTSYELARHPGIQAKLHQELTTAFPDPNQLLDIETLEKLPVLDGVVREGLRLHGAIPSYLERITPESGLKICGYSIPQGTIVGMQAYTSHRDPTVFPEPEVFVPERWFEHSAAMNVNFLPFSAGPRACVGLK
jgi:cytochrome P450